jgi:hypothetical protein
MIHLMNHNYMNLKNYKAFLISLREAYRDPNYLNTTK